MKYSIIVMTTTALALSLGLAGGASAFGDNANTGGMAGNYLADSQNSLAVDHNNLSLLSPDNSVNLTSSNLSAPKAVTVQDLKGVVVGNSFNFNPQQAAAAAGGSGGSGGAGAGLVGGAAGAGGDGYAAAAASSGAQPIYTGDIAINGAAFQNFAGIQTASFDSGIGSNALAATGVTANANVNFSHN